MKHIRLLQQEAIDLLNQPSRDKRLIFYSYQDTLDQINSPLIKFNEVNLFNGDDVLEFIPTLDRVAIDFETTGLDVTKDEIIIIGLVTHTHKICIDCRYYSKEYIKRVLACLNDKCELIAFSLQYEFRIAYFNYGVELDIKHDPQIIVYILTNQPNPTLKNLAKQYLQRYPKDLQTIAGRKFTKGNPYNIYEILEDEIKYKELIAYCVEDCFETLLLSDILLDKLNQDPKLRRIYEIDLKATIAASKMSVRGIRLNEEKLKETEENLKIDIQLIQREIKAELGYIPNVKSFNQMQELLFNKLKLDTEGLEKTKTGYKIDKFARDLLKPLHSIVELIDEWITYRDALSKFIEPLKEQVNEKTGRIHTTFRTTQTITGRLSSTNPNLQNIPNPAKNQLGKTIRSFFIPSDGFSLVACDYSSFELRILAHFVETITGETTLSDVFRADQSLHDIVTCRMFDLDVLDMQNPEHVLRRTLVKNINFGIVYGMTAYRLLKACRELGLDWDLKYCEEFIDEYYKSVPGLRLYLDYLKIYAIVHGYTETLFGRRRLFKFNEDVERYLKGLVYDPKESSIIFNTIEKKNLLTYKDYEKLRQAQNAPIQGSNADVIRIAMYRSFDELVKEGSCHLLLTVHDELVFEVRLDLVAHYMKEIKDLMEDCVKLVVPVRANVTTALNWGDCK